MQTAKASARHKHAIASVLAAAVALAAKATALTAADCVRFNLLDIAEERMSGTRGRILAIAAKAENSQAMLYRVEVAGKEPSFLFGTVHVADERLQSLPPEVESALGGARIVALERGDVSEDAVRSVMPLAARLMMQPQDSTLDASLSDDEMQVVVQAVVEAGLPERLARLLRPWAATLFLASSQCERLRFEAGLKPLDAIVLETARKLGVSIIGLETILEQYEALASVPFDLQEIWLKSSIALHPHIDDMSETTVALYLNRHLEAVWPLTVELTKQSGMSDEIVARLRREIVDNRNHRMALRAQPLLEQGGAFIAVGAMHLTGSEGLVALIVRNGLKVTPIL